MGVSLWIMPSDRDSVRLKRLMSLQRPWTAGGDSMSYPDFIPHVTLASDPLFSEPGPRQKLRKFISEVLPPTQVEISFESIETGNHYFRSVFIAMRLTPEISLLHTEIHKALNIKPRLTPSFPHLSLCYIGGDDDAVVWERQRWKQALVESGRVTSALSGGVRLNCGDENGEDEWISKIKACEIWIVNCVGDVGEWEVLEKIFL